MKITRNIFIILYAILLVINDPQVARAHTIEGIGISQAGIIENKPVYVDPYEETGQKAYHITYILNGGENSIPTVRSSRKGTSGDTGCPGEGRL